MGKMHLKKKANSECLIGQEEGCVKVVSLELTKTGKQGRGLQRDNLSLGA